MEIFWLGTATVEVVSQGKHILIDPYFQKSLRAVQRQKPALEAAIARADAVLVTHPHMDHFSDVGRVVKLTDAPVYVAPRGILTAQKKRVDVTALRPLQGGMTIEVGEGLSVRVWQSRHVKFDGALVRRVVRRACLPSRYLRELQIWERHRAFPSTDDDIFGFEILGEGKRLFVLGSANLREGVDYPAGMDGLCFPYQGRSNLAEYSAALIERLAPRRIVLTHFDDAFPPISEHIDTTDIRTRFPNAEEPAFNEPIVI